MMAAIFIMYFLIGSGVAISMFLDPDIHWLAKIAWVFFWPIGALIRFGIWLAG